MEEFTIMFWMKEAKWSIPTELYAQVHLILQFVCVHSFLGTIPSCRR